MLKTLSTLFIIAIWSLSISAQAPMQSASPDEYNAALQAIQSDGPSWAAVVRKADPGTIKISYKHGSAIDTSERKALDILSIIQEIGAKERAKPSLENEVRLLYAIEELRSDLDRLSSEFISFEPGDSDAQNSLIEWSAAISDLAFNRIGKVELAVFAHTIAHASEAEKPCGSAPPAKKR